MERSRIRVAVEVTIVSILQWTVGKFQLFFMIPFVLVFYFFKILDTTIFFLIEYIHIFKLDSKILNRKNHFNSIDTNHHYHLLPLCCRNGMMMILLGISFDHFYFKFLAPLSFFIYALYLNGNLI